MDKLESTIHRMQYHLKLLGDTVDRDEYPVTALVLSMDWDENDLGAAHDIFEDADKQIESGLGVDWGEFEGRLKTRFDIDYQEVKLIVVAFFRNRQWTEVCRQYARAYTCSEFHEITLDDGV